MRMALEGIKVVEVSTWVAAPMCGVMLAEFGADVIRVEPLNGDPVRGLVPRGASTSSGFNWWWEMWNRSKRGMALDIATAEGREIVHKLAAQSDVFLTNLRPGVLTRSELEYETIREVNPRIIYAHITGYGLKGPETERPSFDSLAFWARGGFPAVLGEPDAPPVALEGAMGDHPTGGLALAGIALALYARERTGIGQKVDVSLLSSGCWVNGVDLQFALAFERDHDRTSRRRVANPLSNSYQAECGRWLRLCMMESVRYWPAFCQALGRPDLEHDPRFESDVQRAANREELISLLEAVFATKSRDEWAPLLDQHRLPWDPVQSMTEVAQDPSVLANGYVTEYEHFTGQRVRAVASPVQLSETPAEVRFGAPEHGQHNEEILLELGFSWDDIERLKEKKAIL
jgi:crotonobetainyl-CoA:carnitine CoA-transferase CaiB-like acyl-CoA transferase